MKMLGVRSDGIYVDATYGRGGHSAAILSALGPEGRLLAMDRDPEAVAAGRERFGGDARFSIEHRAFSEIGTMLEEKGLAGRIDGIVMDLGVSSPQLEHARRGFSFRKTAPLDMRMNPHEPLTAAAWLNRAREDEIVKVLRDYGEERYARRIARAIVERRRQAPVETTGELAALVAGAVPAREPDKDPATRTFQAIRIHINRELEELDAALPAALAALKPGGRLLVISFHSLEDRRVKRFFQRESRGDEYPPDFPIEHARLRPRLRIAARPIRPGAAEIERNPRARSATLRVAERIA